MRRASPVKGSGQQIGACRGSGICFGAVPLDHEITVDDEQGASPGRGRDRSHDATAPADAQPFTQETGPNP